MQQDETDKRAEAIFDANQENICYGLLLKKYTDDILQASDAQIEQAAWDTVPNVFTLFWSFRIMVACGIYFILLFTYAFYLAQKRRLDKHRWFLWVCLFSLPLPWVATQVGWLVAEYGRQPWLVEGLLPTFMGVSSVSANSVLISLAGFVLFYSALAIVELFLMIKYIRLGPDGIYAKNDFSVQVER